MPTLCISLIFLDVNGDQLVDPGVGRDAYTLKACACFFPQDMAVACGTGAENDPRKRPLEDGDYSDDKAVRTHAVTITMYIGSLGPFVS